MLANHVTHLTGRWLHHKSVITFHLRYFAFQSTLPGPPGPALGLLPRSTGLARSLYSCLERPGGTGDRPWTPPPLPIRILGSADPPPNEEERRDRPALPLRSTTISSPSSEPSC